MSEMVGLRDAILVGLYVNMKWVGISVLALVSTFFLAKALSTPRRRTFTIVTPTTQTLFGRKILSGDVTIFFDKETTYTNLETKKITPCVFALLSVKAEKKHWQESDYLSDQICLPYSSERDPTRSDSFAVTYSGGDFEHNWRDAKDESLWGSYHRIQKASLELKKREKNQYVLKYDYQGIQLEWSNTTFKAEVATESPGKTPIKEDRSLELVLLE